MKDFEKKPAVILLVEDDLGDQELIRRALKECDVENKLYIANDGEEALDYLFRRGNYNEPSTAPVPHLILLDINMPKLSGKDVLAQVRATPYLRAIPIVILTTSKDEEEIILYYQLGINSYIIKPVMLDEFVLTITTLITYWFKTVVLPL